MSALDPLLIILRGKQILCFSYGRVYAADPYATALAAPTAAAYGVGAMVRQASLAMFRCYRF